VTSRQGLGRIAAVITGAALVGTGCSSTATPSPDSAPSATATSSPGDEPRRLALATYDEFWRISEAAMQSPGTHDWASELHKVAEGQALKDTLTDVSNYASYPAHVEGNIKRVPQLQQVTVDSPTAVTVVDCLDATSTRVVADKTGESLSDTTNQTPRYHFRAHVVQDSSSRWLVQTTEPLLDERC
jgi:hypothetical protein